jgi:hypothetical protein
LIHASRLQYFGTQLHGAGFLTLLLDGTWFAGLGGADAVLNLSTLDGMWLLTGIGVVQALLTFGLTSVS